MHRSSMAAVSEPRESLKLLPVAALLLTMFFWGSAAVFLRTTALALTPENSLALRYVALTVINAGGLLLLGTWRIPRKDWPRFLLTGIAGMAGYNWFVNQGFALVPAGLGTIITMIEPIMIAFLAWALLKEALPSAIYAGLGVSFVGAIILFWPNISNADASTLSFTGVGALLLCCLCWALYTILAKPLLDRYDPFTVTAVTMIVAAPFLIIPASEPLNTLAARLDTRQWLEMAYLVIPNGVLGTLLWNYGSKQLPGAVTGAFLYLIPVIAVICGALVLDEAITPWIVAGGALMLGGVAIAQFGLPRFR
jgi:drug/metabolite transporter (DMT)-like permease